VTIFSFDDVIRMQKRIHAIPLTPTGEYTIPLPRSVPWIGFVYWIVTLLIFIVAAKVPVLDVVSESFAPLVYYGGFPIAVVWLAFNVELEGLKPHAWALVHLRYLRRPKRTLAGRAVPAEGEKISYSGRASFSWDLNAPRLHRGWVKGGRVVTTVPVRFTFSLRHRRQVIAPSARGRLADHDVESKLQVRA
jgi:hypothetical protein